MTQKYEPVEWTDETPTQPGTLINKARLDQMQSAHHYADGFEEVDAIPTEDPGTAYHKVVYCTADSTFYRWDGNEWTADIDDDTKRLLLEHEADHSNPHAVTKAQVGLGNVDNTSDANKPISTATQTALDGKVDKLGSSPAGSYTKVTVNAQGQVTAGSNPATLAEAGITDAYTKSEINTKLGDGSVTKLGAADVGSDTQPIKLVAGVATAVADALAKNSTVVHLTGDEVISDGIKANTTSGSSSASNTKDVPPRFVVQSTGFDRTALQGINRHYPVAGLNDKNGKPVAKLNISTTDAAIYAYLQAIGIDEGQATLEIGKFDRTTKTWSPTMVNDALDSYATMVRTVNNQTIAGTKTFTDEILGRIYSNKSVHIYDGTANWYKVFSISTTERQQHILEVDYIDNVRNVTGEGRVLISHAGGENVCKFINYYANPASYIVPGNIALCVGSSSIDIWAKRSNIHHIHIGIIKSMIGSNAIFMPESKIAATYDSTQGQASIPEADYSAVVYGTDISSDYVHTSGAETIAGTKTFTDTMAFSTANLSYILRGSAAHGTIPASNDYKEFAYRMSGSETNHGLISFITGASTGTGNIRIRMRDYAGANSVDFNLFAGTDKYMTGPSRAYNANNTYDIVTLELLDQYTPMVRTTGNQTISGNKTFVNQTAFDVRVYRKDGHDTQGYVSASNVDVAATPPASNVVYPKIVFRDNNDTLTGEIAYAHLTNGTYSMYIRIRNTDGTWKYVTLGTSDVIA